MNVLDTTEDRVATLHALLNDAAVKIGQQRQTISELREALGELLRWCPAKRDEWSSREAFEQFTVVRDAARAALAKAQPGETT